MEVLILAGGLGTRLKSVVSDKPKPLADVNGVPFLEHQIHMLRQQTQDNIILCLGYKSEIVIEYFNHCNFAHILYSVEKCPLGTGGAIKNAAALIQDNDFLVINGDTYFELDLAAISKFHHQQQAAFTMLLNEVADTSRYGSVEMDVTQRICRFMEKGPTRIPGYINAGAYVINQKILTEIPDTGYYSIEKQLLPRLLAGGTAIYGYKYTGYFIDIGIPEDYYRFQADLLKGRV